MKYVIFHNVLDAEEEQRRIADLLGLGKPGMATTRWANPRKTKLGLWAIPTPFDGASEPEWPDDTQ